MIFLAFFTTFLNVIFAQNTKEKQILWTADWNRNENIIAIGGNIDSLNIYSGINLKLIKSFPVKNTITRAKFHPTKNILAVTTQFSEDTSFIINLENNKKIVLDSISKEGARGLDWDNSGKYLAVADNDGQVIIYNSEGNFIRKFQNDINSSKSITAIDWHPYKNILVTVSDKIRIFSDEGKLFKEIKHREEDILLLSVAWHKSGNFFVTGDYGYDNYKSLLQYWDENGNLLLSNDISKGEYRNLSWNPKGDLLATASDALRIWDKNENLISEGNFKDFLWGISWNKNGKKIVTTSIAEDILLWNKNGKILFLKQ